ncbi:MAG: type I-MYXAN CRISPR-associated protein Cmx8 [Candidatus Latescibacteria bacterium]|nr:type I-MYXAN CRISPR-associated protein Cmx8 [Candidatus Latescibacterota bacterium]
MSKKQAASINAIELEYDLFSLPTAQHKAGLAGLLLMIESMNMRHMQPMPEILECSAIGAKLKFTRDSIQVLFDDLFAASWEEVSVRSQWRGKQPKRVEEQEVAQEDGKTKKEKRFIYEVVQPHGEFLRTLYPAGNDGWIKLWRDMLWNTLRAQPTTRKVYEERAEHRSSVEAQKVWQNLATGHVLKEAGKVKVEGIVGTLFIGAQDVNPEKVPFQGAAEQNFLLYFWTIPSLVYSPRTVTIERKNETVEARLDDKGYVIIVPEPADLHEFVDEAKRFLQSLDPAMAGYRPKAAWIELPEEGGLEYLYHITRQRLMGQDIQYSLAAVEIYHLERQGNNSRLLSGERLSPSSRLLRAYEAMREHCENPIYRARRIRNLLAGVPWYEDALADFNGFPWTFFLRKEGRMPKRMAFFGKDVRKTFEAIEAELAMKQGGVSMSSEEWDDHLALRVYKLTQNYVNRKTEEKSGIKYESFKENKNPEGRVIYPEKYREAREKVCSDAFLAMRGRREQDFVEYFTGTMCSVPQWLPEDDFVAVSRALMTEWEKVKTLSMLALSACS